MNFTEHPIAQMKLKKISRGLLGVTCLGYVEHIAQLAPKSNKVNIKSWYFTLQCAVERSFLGCEASKQKGLLYDD